jgi:uncharacterized protein (TIGR00251 family)
MGLIIEIKVIPRSGKSTFQLDPSGKLRAYLVSPPEDGKANKELIKLLAQGLSCTQSAIRIVAGATVRNKKIHIDLPLTRDDVITKLGFAVQTKLV